MSSTPRLVDPFMPLDPRSRSHGMKHRGVRTARPGTNKLPGAGYMHAPVRQSLPLEHKRIPQPPTYSRGTAHPVQTRSDNQAKASRSSRIYLIPTILSAILIGLLAQSLVFGEIVIAAYALVVLIKHIPSGTTFLIALATITCAVIAYAAGNHALASIFCAYVLLLLIVGAATLGNELRIIDRHSHR